MFVWRLPNAILPRTTGPPAREPNAIRFNTKVAGTLCVPSTSSRAFKGFGTWKMPATF